MTPAARIETAAELLDRIGAGEAAEKVLTSWARRSRFAGSSDRAAIRDSVFDALRCRRSYAWIGSGASGRATMLGYCRAQGIDPAEIFTGTRYAPAALSDLEREVSPPLAKAPRAVRLDVPDWLLPHLDQTLGTDTEKTLLQMRERAPVFLRSNALKGTREIALDRLKGEGFEAHAHGLAETAIVVEGATRKLSASDVLRDGLVEFQDASSQAVVERLAPHLPNASVLDYCAGGGGKALGMAAHAPARIVAYDANSARMGDIEPRAARAGARIDITTNPTGKFDLVVCDAPCSGSGAWRRQPEAKWRLDQQMLNEFAAVQDAILEAASKFARFGGHLAYITCSLLSQENGDRVAGFLAQNPAWKKVDTLRLTPLEGGDGFYLAVLKAPDETR